MKASPTQRALAHYKSLGYRTCITEKWNAWAGVKQDLFGFIDLVALTGSSILGVQVTSGAHHTARVAKILALEAAKQWLISGGKIVVMSFYKKANGRYTMREEEITVDRFL